MLDAALARMDAPAPKTIIDIGSGSGNSVLPLLSKFPNAHVIASDISPNLLAILRDYFKDDEATQTRLSLLCADASQVRFAPESADLVVGAAILHHITEPETVIERAFTALKPGGWAVFFEPFRVGSSLLTLAYKQVLRNTSTKIGAWRQLNGLMTKSPSGLDVLARIVHDYDTRVTMSVERAKTLDDKWMFEKTQFEAIAEKQGWALCKSYSMQDGKAPVRAQTVSYLRLAAGLDETALPDWAWQILDEFDRQLSDDVRKSAWMEGMVLLQKSASTSRQNTDDSTAFNRWYWTPTLDRQGVFLAEHNGIKTLHWCGFDDAGHSRLYEAEVLSQNAATINGAALTVSVHSDGLGITHADGSSTLFQRFIGGAAPATAHATGVYENDHQSGKLLVESRAGIVHAALIDSDTTCVQSGHLSRDEYGWSGMLTEYAGGASPFSSRAGHATATARCSQLRVACIDPNTLAVEIDGQPHQFFRRKIA